MMRSVWTLLRALPVCRLKKSTKPISAHICVGVGMNGFWPPLFSGLELRLVLDANPIVANFFLGN